MTNAADPGSGDRPPPTRLDHPPGERYLTPGLQPGREGTGERVVSPARAVLLGGVVALGGGLLLAGLGILDLGAGLLAVGLAIGWATGIAVRYAAMADGVVALARGPRAIVAAVLALVGTVVGLGLVWAWARAQGGTLGPLDYLGERFALLPPILVALAVVAAALRAR